jgi:hypothetical protein
MIKRFIRKLRKRQKLCMMRENVYKTATKDVQIVCLQQTNEKSRPGKEGKFVC